MLIDITYNSLLHRHQIQHYTQQLAKDTSVHLRELSILANSSGSTSPGEQRQRKMQKERLHDEFTTALNSFQVRMKEIYFIADSISMIVYQ